MWPAQSTFELENGSGPSPKSGRFQKGGQGQRGKRKAQKNEVLHFENKASNPQKQMFTQDRRESSCPRHFAWVS